MPFVRLWVHLVWSTKKRAHLLGDSIRPVVFEHIRANAEKKNIHILEVNGYSDHVHCLVSFKATQSVARVVKLIKGESAHWINKENICDLFFEWQTEYWAVSIGLSEINYTRRYIQNQEEHHTKKSFESEMKAMSMQYFEE